MSETNAQLNVVNEPNAEPDKSRGESGALLLISESESVTIDPENSRSSRSDK